MATFDNEHDETAKEEEESPSKPRQGNRPLLLGAIGLVLMLGGYAAMSYVMAGQLAIFVGLFLFVVAAIQMYRNSPPPTEEIDERE